jgi:hypothetical protein
MKDTYEIQFIQGVHANNGVLKEIDVCVCQKSPPSSYIRHPGAK